MIAQTSLIPHVRLKWLDSYQAQDACPFNLKPVLSSMAPCVALWSGASKPCVPSEKTSGELLEFAGAAREHVAYHVSAPALRHTQTDVSRAVCVAALMHPMRRERQVDSPTAGCGIRMIHLRIPQRSRVAGLEARPEVSCKTHFKGVNVRAAITSGTQMSLHIAVLLRVTSFCSLTSASGP